MSGGGKWRVMVVDDDQIVLGALVEILSEEFEATVAFNGLDALEKLERYEPDLIILDIVMPCVDGIDTCRAIRKNVRFRHVPVIFLSGHDESVYRDRLVGLEASRLLRKPVSRAHLLETCRKALDHSDVKSPTRKRYKITELETLETRTAVSPAGGMGPATEVGTVRDLPQPPDLRRIEAAAGTVSARIMIVDDDRDIISYMLAVLRNRFEAFGVHDPVSAIYKIIRYQPDLIILDISMPRLSGYQLSQLLRLNRNLRTIKFMFASSKDSAQEIAYAKQLGAADYLVKPFEPEALLEKVLGIVEAPDFIIREKAMTFDEIRRAESADSAPSQFI
ncbi:MAG: response regulator [Candidatus Sumerlaeia bacterium]|nr:response regulator [Candidatus Sumerlaeia bacterium]